MSADIELVVVDDVAAAAATVAAMLVEVASVDGSLVLAGGSTPRPAYELATARHADWGGAEIWLGDERCVPPTDPRSNERLVRESLVDRVTDPPLVHPVQTGLSPAEAAAAYDAELRGRPLDLILLGIGPDGHTASLFPNAPSLDERERLVVAADPGFEPFVERVTLTIPALESGSHVVFLVAGAEKADAARRAFGEEPSPDTPASLVRSRQGRTTVVIDSAAAAGLR
jgi:6-phosphogluconolactonase